MPRHLLTATIAAAVIALAIGTFVYHDTITNTSATASSISPF